MGRERALRREEHSDHTANAPIDIEGAKCAEAHAVLEMDDLAHGLHLVAADGLSETMKCSLFQGDA